MPKYRFTAVNMSGKTMDGIYEAQNEQAVIELLRQKSYYHLKLEEITERKDMKEMGIFAKVKAKDLSVYCRQFSSILKAGMPLIKCLNMLADQTENVTLKSITRNVCEDVQKGSGLSQAMSLHTGKIPSILINMIAAGEESGTLDHSLEVMSEHFEKEHKTQAKVKNAMRYPIIVLIVAIIVVVVMLVVVVPTFKGIFSSAGAQLPLPTRMLLGLSDVLQKDGIVLLGVVIVAFIVFRMYISGEKGRLVFDKFKLRMPILGKFLKKSFAARFSRTMSTLLTTGVSITEALKITGKVMGNIYVMNGINDVIEQVKQGKGLYMPIRALQLYPAMLENMIMMGEESGTLDDMLLRSAIFYEDEVDRAAQGLTSMLEPLIIVFLGSVVAFIVIAIMLPMFELNSLVAQV